MLVALLAGAPQDGPLFLRAETPVHLRTTSEITSKTAHVGDLFDLKVSEPVLVDGREVISTGAHAVGSIISADAKSAFGKAGGLAVELLYVEALGRRVRLHGTDEAHGGGGTGAAVVTTMLGGTFSGFVTGRSAKIARGTMMTGFTTRDLPLVAAGRP